MKTLIVYYSHTHNNELLAKNLQKRLACDTFRIEEVKKRTGFTILLDIMFKRTPKIAKHQLLLEDYSNFIFIAPVWAGHIATPLKAFLREERGHIGRYSFITVCGGVKGQREKLFNELTRILNKKPVRVAELWVSDILPEEQRDKVKYTSGYRLKEEDLEAFELKIFEFLKVSDVLLYHQ